MPEPIWNRIRGLNIESDENITIALNQAEAVKSKLFSPRNIAVAAALSFFVALTGGYGIYRYATDPAAVSDPKISTPAEPKPFIQPLPEIMSQMVLLGDGSFQMGRDDVPPQDIVWGNQYPAHVITVNSFYLSKTEVSNEDYAKFIRASGHSAPENWSSGKIPNGQEKFPVTFVSLPDAKNYAEWFSEQSGKVCRLPSEAEWEFAARNGTQQTLFPWGNDWKPDFANIATGNLANGGSSSDETTVGGIRDMLGSVIEWTSSNYELYPAHPGKLDLPGKDLYVIRGSSFGESKDRLKNAEWLMTRRQAVAPGQKSQYLGFRLACQP